MHFDNIVIIYVAESTSAPTTSTTSTTSTSTTTTTSTSNTSTTGISKLDLRFGTMAHIYEIQKLLMRLSIIDFRYYKYNYNHDNDFYDDDNSYDYYRSQ